MALHDSYAKFTKDTYNKLTTGKNTLGLVHVFYGDQERIPQTPTATVDPGGKERTLNGIPRRTEVRMTCYIFVYHYMLASTEDLQSVNDSLAETVEAYLHQDSQLRDTNGIPTVVDSMVTSIESGVMAKRNSLFRVSRLTFEARSQVQLPFAP